MNSEPLILDELQVDFDLSRHFGSGVTVHGSVWIKNWRCVMCPRREMSPEIPANGILIQCPGLATALIRFATAGSFARVDGVTLAGTLDQSTEAPFRYLLKSISKMTAEFDGELLPVDVQEAIRHRKQEIAEIEAATHLTSEQKSKYIRSLQEQISGW